MAAQRQGPVGELQANLEWRLTIVIAARTAKPYNLMWGTSGTRRD